jgi:pimeloyl-ACP methyl ester carboxylesterase
MPTLHETAAEMGVPFTAVFEPLQKELKTPELTMRYLEWGSQESPTVVLLHGFAQTAHSWDFVALSLADRYHVVSLDARGHGDSDWAPDAAYSTADHRRDVQAVVDHLGSSPIAVIGLSMGGGTAYSYTAEKPADISALVIVDAGPSGNPTGQKRIGDFVELPDELDTLDEFIERIHTYVPHRPIEQLRSTVINNVRQNEAGKWIWKYDSVLRDPARPRSGIPSEQAWSYLKNIQCPTLLIRGADSDVLTADTALKMEQIMRDCTLITVGKAGHLVPGDNPVGFISAVRPWLDRMHGIQPGGGA